MSRSGHDAWVRGPDLLIRDHRRYPPRVQLVVSSQVDTLAEQLPSDGGLRIASIKVDFDPFDFARTGAALVDRAVALSTPSGDRRIGMACLGIGAGSVC